MHKAYLSSILKASVHDFPIGGCATKLRLEASSGRGCCAEPESHRIGVGQCNGRNLVSASLLADMLMQICLYCTARGWDADRLVDLADSRNKHSAEDVL
jgi:hypothetical protein